MKKYLAIFGLILVTVIWGGGFVASDMALDSLTPFQIMTFRFFLGTVILGGISLPGRIFHGVCVVCRICAADRGTSVHDTIQKRVFNGYECSDGAVYRLPGL